MPASDFDFVNLFYEFVLERAWKFVVRLDYGRPLGALKAILIGAKGAVSGLLVARLNAKISLSGAEKVSSSCFSVASSVFGFSVAAFACSV